MFTEEEEHKFKHASYEPEPPSQVMKMDEINDIS